MAITGERFLELSKADHFEVSGHALSRLRSRTGAELSEGEALELFASAHHVHPDELLLLGYRPAYGRRLRHGEKSWYFRLTVEGRELIAVIGQVGDSEFLWVTTYARDTQTDLLCAAMSDEAVCVE